MSLLDVLGIERADNSSPRGRRHRSGARDLRVRRRRDPRGSGGAAALGDVSGVRDRRLLGAAAFHLGAPAVVLASQLAQVGALRLAGNDLARGRRDRTEPRPAAPTGIEHGSTSSCTITVVVRVASVLVAVSVCSFALGARAQDDDAAEAEARSLFEAGRAAYDNGRYEAALDYFQRSYDLSRRVGLLFNVGAAADRLQDNERALRAYRAYHQGAPDAPNRALVERRIEFLERAVAARTRDAPPPSAEEPAAPTSAAGGADPAPWIVLGAGAAVAIAGAIVLGLGRADAASVENAPTGSSWADVRDAAERAPALSTAGGVILVVGAAAMAGALVWGLVTMGSGGTEVAVGPGGLVVRGRF